MIDNHPSRDATARFNRPSADTGLIPPACCDCGTSMTRGQLRISRPRSVNRVGAPARPPQSMPVWECPACGCQQPRFES
jgi:hypothetical protein